MENELLPKRKPIRLKGFDYGATRAYFITICTKERKQLLSRICSEKETSVDGILNLHRVGEGLDPPENVDYCGCKDHETGAASYSPTSFQKFISFATYPKFYLTSIGEIAVRQLFMIEERFPSVKLLDYVIMPDHIHAILFFQLPADSTLKMPTLLDVMRVYKSMTARICKREYGVTNLFQRSYIEHVIRDGDDYAVRRKYIYNNPIRWYYEHLE